jgi:ribosomal protein L24E
VINIPGTAASHKPVIPGMYDHADYLPGTGNQVANNKNAILFYQTDQCEYCYQQNADPVIYCFEPLHNIIF